MSKIWSGMKRDDLEALILSSLSRQWTTPSQLEAETGVPWRVLMRALPRLQMYGKVEGRIENVRLKKGRTNPQRRYRLPSSVSLDIYRLFIMPSMEVV